MVLSAPTAVGGALAIVLIKVVRNNTILIYPARNPPPRLFCPSTHLRARYDVADQIHAAIRLISIGDPEGLAAPTMVGGAVPLLPSKWCAPYPLTFHPFLTDECESRNHRIATSLRSIGPRF